MANLDTRNKRASALVLGLSIGRVWPDPDASLANRGDRQHLAYLYAGILSATVIAYFDGLTTSMTLTGVGH